LINIFLLPEKPPLAQDAIEMFKTSVANIGDYNWNGNYNDLDKDWWDGTGIYPQSPIKGFSAFVLDNDTPSSLKRYYPELYKKAFDIFPYIVSLRKPSIFYFYDFYRHRSTDNF